MLRVPCSAITPSTPDRAQSGVYSHVSFAIEPIQLPIVPLNLFSPKSLRTTAGA